MAAVVERDDAEPCPFQRRHPAPVRTQFNSPCWRQSRGTSTDRLTFALIEECDLHTIMGKARHGSTIRRNRPMQESLVPIASRSD